MRFLQVKNLMSMTEDVRDQITTYTDCTQPCMPIEVPLIFRMQTKVCHVTRYDRYKNQIQQVKIICDHLSR